MQFGFIERINDTKLKKRLNLKFVYSEKATKFCDIFTLLLSTVHTDKSNVKISQNFVAFSEYMNFDKGFGHNVICLLELLVH